MNDEVLDPEEIAAKAQSRERANLDDANAVLYVPATWFVAAGRPKPANGALDAPLEPFSFERQVAAQRLDLSSASPFESAVLTVYLCLLERPAIDRARGEREESAFRGRMYDWANAIGCNFGSQSAKRILKLSADIWERLLASEHDPVLPKATGGTAPLPNA